MQNEITRKTRRKGIAIVLTTLTLSVTLPLAGLGFDVATLYLVKSKLGAAADSAALAGARALSQGATSAAQTASAISTAQNYFSGNYPTGYWRTSGASASDDDVAVSRLPIGWDRSSVAVFRPNYMAVLHS